MIGEARDEGMPIVQVEVDALAEPANRARDVEHIPHRLTDGILNVGDQVGQPAVPRAKVPQAQPWMAVREPGRRLPDADVADVEAGANPLSFLEPLRHLHEPAWLHAGGVLEKDDGTVRPLTQACIELAHHGKQAVCLCLHLTAVVDDYTRAGRRTGGESAITARLRSCRTLTRRFRWTTGRYGWGGTNRST